MFQSKITKYLFALTLALSVLNISLFIFASHTNLKHINVDINIDLLERVGAFGYLADLDVDKQYKFYVRGDSRSHPNRSQLTLYINDQEMQDAHAVYSEVVWLGNGKYRHNKNNTLIFSLPNNIGGIDKIRTIQANIKLQYPKVIIKSALFIFIVALILLIYKLVFFANGYKFSTYIRNILFIYFTGSVALYLIHIVKNMNKLISFTADSIYYFSPALSFVNHGILNMLSGPEEQGHTFGFVYPALLALFVSTGSLNDIPLIQSILFLCTVLIFFFLIRHASKSNYNGSESTIFALIAAIILISYFIYTKYTVELMPEIIYQLSSLITIFILSIALTKKLTFSKLAIYSALIIFFVSFNMHVKPHGAAIFLFVWLCVILKILFHTGSVKLKIPLLFALVVMAFGLFHYPNSYLNQYNSPGKTYGPRTLVCNHVNIIEPVIEKHIHDQQAVQFLRTDIQKTLNAPNDWDILGFSGDHCLLNLLTTQKLAEILDLSLEEQSKLYTKLFVSGVLNQPLKYIIKVLKQYTFAISHPYPGRNSIVGRTEGQNYLQEWRQRKDFNQSGLNVKYLQTFYNHPLIISDVDFSWPGRAVLNIFHEFAMPIFILFMLILFIDIFRLVFGKVQFDGFLKHWYLPIFSLAVYLAALSVVAFAHSFDVSRYIQFCSTYAIYFQFCAIGIIGYKCKVLWVRLHS